MTIGSTLTLFLSGDVMLGRGIDQILPHPLPPEIHESYVKTALGYLRIAENANGPITKPVDYKYIWGDALAELNNTNPIARIINLETSVTRSEDWERKGINYRMNPDNIMVLKEAEVDCCVLANNHILDWGKKGLEETLASLHQAGIKTAGAGRNQTEAALPSILKISNKSNEIRILIFGFGMTNAGVPYDWTASAQESGVNFLADFSQNSFDQVKNLISSFRKPQDIVIFSIHWGDNWGYDIPKEHQAFARKLIDEAGVDVIHGHSSHHPKAIEVYQNKLIIYGAGDLINDYEGISSHLDYRGELTLLYFPSLHKETHELMSLRLVPMMIRNFRLNHASLPDSEWLKNMLNLEGQQFGTCVEMLQDRSLLLKWNK